MFCANSRMLAFGSDGRPLQTRNNGAKSLTKNHCAEPMRLKSAIALLTCLAVAWPAVAAPVAPREVEIAEANLTLHAQLFKPDGDGPFPTVIALHGCGGLAGHSEPVL